jgi:hypothetical protein|tara:strand:- start:185 stop:418 length:234 start_codon:yes stop_codon:yes gene_type:complete
MKSINIEDLIDDSPTNKTHSFDEWFLEMQKIVYEKSGQGASNNLRILNEIKPSLVVAYGTDHSVEETLIAVNKIGSQ